MADNAKVTIKFHGTLKSAFNSENKNDNGNVVKSTNIINLYREGLQLEKDGETIEGLDLDTFFDDLFESVAKKWVPDWYKEEKDFISAKSTYNIPCMIDDEKKQMSFAEFVERGNIRDAKVILKCNLKNNAFYPNAMMILEEGTPYDAFEDF